jgi:hypothetical protein
MSAIAFEALKSKLLPQIRQEGLPLKTPNKRLTGIYFSQSPDVLNDTLSFHLFRLHTAFHYPILYFHPQSRRPDPAFASAYSVTSLGLPDEMFRSKITYSHFITSTRFHDELKRVVPDGEFHLIFQADSFLIKPGVEKLMDLPYDYFGAVWEKGLVPGGLWSPALPSEVIDDPQLHARVKPTHVGNGGISLRRNTAMEKVSRTFQITQLNYQQEDVFYTLLGQLTKMRIAPVEWARRFAWEDSIAISHYLKEWSLPTPFAIHNLTPELTEFLVRPALEQNPINHGPIQHHSSR